MGLALRQLPQVSAQLPLLGGSFAISSSLFQISTHKGSEAEWEPFPGPAEETLGSASSRGLWKQVNVLSLDEEEGPDPQGCAETTASEVPAPRHPQAPLSPGLSEHEEQNGLGKLSPDPRGTFPPLLSLEAGCASSGAKPSPTCSQPQEKSLSSL